MEILLKIKKIGESVNSRTSFLVNSSSSPLRTRRVYALDDPAYIRKGIDISVNALKTQEEVRNRINKTDPEKPAFLQKIMA